MTPWRCEDHSGTNSRLGSGFLNLNRTGNDDQAGPRSHRSDGCENSEGQRHITRNWRQCARRELGEQRRRLGKAFHIFIVTQRQSRQALVRRQSARYNARPIEPPYSRWELPHRAASGSGAAQRLPISRTHPELTPALMGDPFKTLVQTGSPFQEITDAARSMKVDVVVMSTRRWPGLPHQLLGSTAERVVRHAPCPVLVIR